MPAALVLSLLSRISLAREVVVELEEAKFLIINRNLSVSEEALRSWLCVRCQMWLEQGSQLLVRVVGIRSSKRGKHDPTQSWDWSL